MAIYHPADERSFELQGNHMVGLAPGDHAANVEVWRACMEAGAATPPHRHDTEEVVVVLRGRGRATIGDEEVTFGPGDTIVLPAGKLHQIFSETESESIAVMPRRSTIRSADGEVMNLPWRR
jgi:quercetin dioxygenase-like cupin family protein